MPWGSLWILRANRSTQKVLKNLSVEGLKVKEGVIWEARKQARGLEQEKRSKYQELEKAEAG